MVLSFLLFNIFLLFFWTIAADEIKWNVNKTESTATPSVRRYLKEWRYKVLLSGEHYHHKTHFGLIIKGGTKFEINVKCADKIERLFFYCLAQVPRGASNMVDLKNKGNFTIFMTANFDCVPMTSVSYNVPVKIKITTTNWTTLPIFDTRTLTAMTSEESEKIFYKEMQSYGFVENYYTQMFLTKADLEAMKSSKYSLYLGLQNQADLVQYYDYLIGASRYNKEPLNYRLMDQQSIFLRTVPCHSDFFKTSKKVSFPCENDDKSCKYKATKCNYSGYFSKHSLVIRRNIKEFLQPVKGSSWLLLHEVGHNYNIETKNVGFESTTEVWNNIFATMYQFKLNRKEYWVNNTFSVNKGTLTKYRNGIFITEWSTKQQLQFFMSLFGFDGTDITFREFHIRHYPGNYYEYEYFSNMIPTLLEVFLDLHDINVLPYLRIVINFKQYTIPLVNPDLELRLMSATSVMPAVDFNVSAQDFPSRSKERDLRFSTPLVLLKTVPRKEVWVLFNFNFTTSKLINECLYLNNLCYNIHNKSQLIRLYAGVYSSYVASKIDDVLYVSDVVYHTIAENKSINISVEEFNTELLPLIYYSIDIFGMSDQLFARIFINYRDMTIAISQFNTRIHSSYAKRVYCSMELMRNSTSVFEHKFYGTKANKPMTNVVHKFKFGDELHYYHIDPKRKYFINGHYKGLTETSKNILVLTNMGLHNKNDGSSFNIVLTDVERIKRFNEEHKILLTYNPLYQFYLQQYAHILTSNKLGKYVPHEWFLQFKTQ